MPIRYEVAGGVATFTIDNGKVNAIDPPMHRELHDALGRFERDPDVKVGILRGAGERAFSAGDDLKFVQRPLDPAEKLTRHFYPVDADLKDPGYPGHDREVMAMRRFKPIVGAVSGWCLGRGLMYLLHLTDIRVAGEGARFGLPEIRYGMGGGGASTLIHRHIPRAVALQMLLTGEPIDAAEALRIHLVNRVVPDTDVFETAAALANQIASHPQSAIRIEMEAFQRTEDMDRDNALALAEHMYRLQRLVSTVPNTDIKF
jgi:enoyl-CoA hydratase/carnithine racemase